MPGASLTSTSVDIHTATDSALYDEEELMYDAIVNPPKGKKDKDVGKRRAYVRVVTSLGGGSLNLELFCEKVRPSLTSAAALRSRGAARRRRRHATTSSCSRGRASTTTCPSTASCPGS